jgi:hypothetical protein
LAQPAIGRFIAIPSLAIVSRRRTLSNLTGNVARLVSAVRSQQAIENRQHGVIDSLFHEES